MNSDEINNETKSLIMKTKLSIAPRNSNKKLEQNMSFWKTSSLTVQQQLIWEIHKTRQKTKTKWLNHSYPSFQIFDVFCEERSNNYFLYTFFHKEGQGSDNLDVICRDKGDALQRATYHKNYRDWTKLCYGTKQTTNGFYCLCVNRFCLASTVWTHPNSTGCFKRKATSLFQ